ncbi:MAG: hypothetical protein WCG87_11065 [Bacteroidota bacterium]
MENFKNNIDDLLKERLGNYTETPPSEVWDALEKKLDGNKDRGFLYYRRFWFSLFFALIALEGVSFIWTKTTISFKQIIDNQQFAPHNKSFTKEEVNSNIDNITLNKTHQISIENSSNKLRNNNTNIRAYNRTSEITHSNMTDGNDNNNKISNSSILSSNKGVSADATNEYVTEKTSSIHIDNGSKNNLINEELFDAKQSDVSKNEITTEKVTKETSIHNSLSIISNKTTSDRVFPKESIRKIAVNASLSNKKALNKPINAKPNNSIPNINKTTKHNHSEPECNTINKATIAENETRLADGKANLLINDIANSKDKNNNPNSISSLPPSIASNNKNADASISNAPINSNLAVTKSEIFANSQTITIAKEDSHDNINTLINRPVLEVKDNSSIIVSADHLNKYEAGIKAGYELGMNSGSAQKIIVSPYLQYNMNSKFSILTQPAIKFSKVSSRNLTGTQSFYKVNNDGNYHIADSTIFVPIVGGGDTMITRNYAYSQTHDSIVKSYVTNNSYIEFELPILLKYNVTDKLSVYGGLNINYSKLIGISENTYTIGPITKTGSSSTVSKIQDPIPSPANINNIITYSGSSITDYKAPLYPNTQSDIVRFGYMLGISYEFNKKWLIDALIQQCSAKSNIQGGYDINTPLSSMYFRLTLGYKLF